MKLVDSVTRWREAIALLAICGVFASLQWNVLRNFATDGPTVLDSPYEVALFVMLLVTFGALFYEVRRTASS